MKIFTISLDALPKTLKNLLVLIFWLGLWQLAAFAVGDALFLPDPLTVTRRLAALVFQSTFWRSVLNSLFKILSGFLLAAILGTLSAAFATVSPVFCRLVNPLFSIIQATPMASFTMLAFLWIDAADFSFFIPLLMVIPIIYTNIYQGILQTDRKLLEMAQVFDLGLSKTLRHIYLPQLKPYFATACIVGLGFAWKSGIAAEVIGISKNTIGENLYTAKLYWETADLFAWTVVVILLSMSLERLFYAALRQPSGMKNSRSSNTKTSQGDSKP